MLKSAYKIQKSAMDIFGLEISPSLYLPELALAHFFESIFIEIQCMWLSCTLRPLKAVANSIFLPC